MRPVMSDQLSSFGTYKRVEWAPEKEKINKHTKLGNKEQIKQALGESTRAVVTPDGWKLTSGLCRR